MGGKHDIVSTTDIYTNGFGSNDFYKVLVMLCHMLIHFACLLPAPGTTGLFASSPKHGTMCFGLLVAQLSRPHRLA